MKFKLVNSSIVLWGLLVGGALGLFVWNTISNVKTTNDTPREMIICMAIAGAILIFFGPVLFAVNVVFNRIDDRENDAEIWRHETANMSRDEVAQYKSLLKACGIRPKGDNKDE